MIVTSWRNHLKYLLLFLLIATLHAEEQEAEKEDPYALRKECYPYLQRIRTKFKAEMKKNHDLFCNGEGGQANERLHLVHFDFAGLRRASIEEARELIVKATDRLLELINENEHLRPYLYVHPFTPYDLDITITFFSDPDNFYRDGSVTGVSQYNRKIIYNAYPPTKIPGDSLNYEILEENYDVAKKTIAEHPLPYDLKIHQPTPYEAEMDLFQLAFADKMLKKWRLYSENSGGSLAKGIDRVGFHFILLGHQTEEEARELLVKVSEELVQDLNANAKLKPYFVHSPITYEDIDMQISFWKSTELYYQDQSVAEICQQGNKILYFKIPLNHDPKRDPSKNTISKLPALEESYEEAVKLISQKRISL